MAINRPDTERPTEQPETIPGYAKPSRLQKLTMPNPADPNGADQDDITKKANAFRQQYGSGPLLADNAAEVEDPEGHMHHQMNGGGGGGSSYSALGDLKMPEPMGNEGAEGEAEAAEVPTAESISNYSPMGNTASQGERIQLKNERMGLDPSNPADSARMKQIDARLGQLQSPQVRGR